MTESAPSGAASTVDPAEIERFSRIAEEWWDPAGKFAPLHRLNPVRLGYIRDRAATHWNRDALSGLPLEGLSLLDIGCGWGALVIRAAQKFGAQCVGITLSQNQFDLATERVRAAGLQDRIEIRLQDYRDIQGQFDRIVSIEMIEAVGERYWPSYFRTVAERLKPGGRALIQSITTVLPLRRQTPLALLSMSLKARPLESSEAV